ncbi:uncharacterized protein LOC126733597 isoform X3 [Anthonomus grandis grandis]|uniref:uncharacterized protein LOC126733597 isoform X3 n=1 Tax=Anthonomus grandis grandis TaxID=2921223 RepID=UPI0021667E63|nr:uncharacterized protein LOC126733597 isoform X3 [Anthonomus grandis grandis]
MYKFLCANITKPRNVSNAYKKLVQAQKVHQDSSKPSSAPGQKRPTTEGQHEENQEFEDENMTNRPSTSPSHLQRSTALPPVSLPTFKPFPEVTPLKMKSYPKFYTGHFIRIDPPTPSISKKYYHVYSINGPSLKRSNGSLKTKKLTEQDRENYLSALESLHDIERNKSGFQFKAVHRPSKAGTAVNEAYLKQFNKKKFQKADSNGSIRYPTHTIKHTLKINRRYKIRQESAERRIKELEEKHRKKYHMKMFMPPPPTKKITYPTLVEHIKKGKLKIPMPEKKYLEKGPVEASEANQEPHEDVTLEQPQDALEHDFDSLVRSHPTIENASKEVKMKLKTKFIQLLIKTARSPRFRSERQLAAIESKQEESAALVPVSQETSPEKAVIIPEDAEELIVSHPKKWTKPPVSLEDSYHVIYRYPRRVYVDEPSKYEVDKVCVKESGVRISSDPTPAEEQRLPPTLYTTNHLSTPEAVKYIENKNAEAIKQLNWGKEGHNQAKIEQLKEERLLLLKELDKLSVKFSSTAEEKEDKPPSECEWREGNKEFTKEQAEKLRRILLGQFHVVQPSVEPENNPKWPWNKNKTNPESTEASKETEAAPSCIEQEENVQEQEAAAGEVDAEEASHDEKKDDVMLCQEGLEEKSKVDELNEIAKEREKVSRKEKLRQEQQRKRKEIRELNDEKYTRKTYIPPRVDKIDDMLDEKVEIGEKVKEQIEKLIPGRQVNQPSLPESTILAAAPAAKEEPTTIEEKTKIEELQEMAEDLAKKSAGQEQSSGYNQPETKRIIKKFFKNRENEKKIEQDQKVKNDVKEFFQKKRQQWGLGAKQVSQEQEEERDEFQGRSESTPPEKDTKDKKEEDKKEEETPKDDSEKRAEDERHRLQKDKTTHDRPLYPTGPMCEKEKDNIDKNLLTSALEEKSLVVSEQTVQENFPQIKGIYYATEEKSVPEEFVEKYVDPNAVSTDIMAKEKMVINNIEETKVNEQLDAAVLRPGDEILIYENNGAQTKTDVVKVDTSPDKQAECTQLTMNILDKALTLRNELALSESRVLLDTKKQIDEMMEKIKNLEEMLKKQEASWRPDEIMSENKIRVPTPQPPPDKDKAKDSKKDKSRDKNALILPPKVQGSKPEKSAKDLEEFNCKEREQVGELTKPPETDPDPIRLSTSPPKTLETKMTFRPRPKLTFQDIINPQKPTLKSTTPKNDNQNTLLSKAVNSRLSKTLHSSVVNLDKKKDSEEWKWSRSMSKLDKVNAMLQNSTALLEKAKVGHELSNVIAIEEIKKNQVEFNKDNATEKENSIDISKLLHGKAEKESKVIDPKRLFHKVKQAAEKKLTPQLEKQFNAKARQYLMNQAKLDDLAAPKIDVLEKSTSEEKVGIITKIPKLLDSKSLFLNVKHAAEKKVKTEEQLNVKAGQYFTNQSKLDGLDGAGVDVLAEPAIEKGIQEDFALSKGCLSKPTLEEKDVGAKVQKYFKDKVYKKSDVGEGVNNLAASDQENSSILKNAAETLKEISQSQQAKSLDGTQAAKLKRTEKSDLVELEFKPDPLEKHTQHTEEELLADEELPVDPLSKPALEQEDVDLKVRHYFQNKFGKLEATVGSKSNQNPPAVENPIINESLTSGSKPKEKQVSNTLKSEADAKLVELDFKPDTLEKLAKEEPLTEDYVPTVDPLSKPALAQEDDDAKIRKYFENKLAKEKPTGKKLIFSKNFSTEQGPDSGKTLKAKSVGARPKVFMKPLKNVKMSCSPSTGLRSVSCPGKAQSQAIQETKTQFSSWSSKSGHQITRNMGKIFSLEEVKKTHARRPASHTSQNADKPPYKPQKPVKNYLSKEPSPNHLNQEKDRQMKLITQDHEVEEDREVVAITAEEKPVVFWPNKNQEAEVLQKKEPRKISELAEEFQETLKAIPKVYYPSKDKNLDKSSKNGAIIKMSPKKVILKPKTRKVLEMSSCKADENLQQNESLGIMRVTLPLKREQREEGRLSLAADGRRPKDKYANDSRLFKGSGVSDVGLKIEKNKNVAKAGISTTSVLCDNKDLEDDFSGLNQKKNNKKSPKEKTAIFRIMKNDEIFIVKNAEEDENPGEKPKKASGLSDQKKTVDHLVEQLITLKDDHVAKVNLTPKRELSTIFVATTGSNHKGYMGDLIFKNQRLVDTSEKIKEVVLETLPPITKPKIHQTLDHTLKVTTSKIKPKEKLMAKVQEVMEKPVKPEGTVSHRYKSELKLSNCHDDHFSWAYLGSVTFPKVCLKAKIETIYEKGASIKEPRKQKLRKFNRWLVENEVEEQREPLFNDQFQGIKTGFFERDRVLFPDGLLKSQPPPPPSPMIKSEIILKKHTRKPKPEKPSEQTILKSRSESVVKTPVPQSAKTVRVKEQLFPSALTIKVEKNYSELLKKIEKNLRDKRKKLEVQVNPQMVQPKVLEETPAETAPVDDSMKINKSHTELFERIEKRLQEKRSIKATEVKQMKPEKQPLLANSGGPKMEKTYTEMLKKMEKSMHDEKIINKSAIKSQQAKTQSMYTLSVPKLVAQSPKPFRTKSAAPTNIPKENLQIEVKPSNTKKKEVIKLWQKEKEIVSKENLQEEIECWAGKNNLRFCTKKSTKIGQKLKSEFVDAMKKHKTAEASSDDKKYPLDKEVDYMSVDKSVRRIIQKEEQGARVEKPEVTLLETEQVDYKGERFKKQLSENIRQRLNRSKQKENTIKKRKNTKKDTIKEMNETAKHIIKSQNERQWQELYNGGKKGQNDAKLSQPSVGPWTRNTKPESDKDKKHFHCSTKASSSSKDSKPPSMDRLMSKDDFLKLKQTKGKPANNLKKSYLADERLPSGSEIGVTMSSHQHCQIITASKLNQPTLEFQPKYTEMEIYKYELEANKDLPTITGKNALDTNPLKIDSKQKEMLEKVTDQAKIGDLVENYFKRSPRKPTATDPNMALHKRIDQEVKKEASRPDIPPPKIDPEVLNFKITKMVKMMAEDVKFNEVKVTVGKGRETTTVKTVAPEMVVKKPNVVVNPVEEFVKEAPKTVNVLDLTKVDEGATVKSNSGSKNEVLSKKSNLEPKEVLQSSPVDANDPKASNTIVAKPVRSVSMKNAKNDELTKSPEPEQSRSEKFAERLKSINMMMKNFKVNSTKDPHANKKTSEKDEEARKTNGANFLLKPPSLPHRVVTRKKNKKPNISSKIPIRHQSTCKKFMKNYKFVVTEVNPHQTTLDRKVGQDFSVVPKHVMETEERMRKARKRMCVKDLRAPDPLDKYKHLKITYMSVKRKQDDGEKELFMPSIEKMDDKEIQDQKKRKILDYRFNLLKKLNEEFQKQMMAEQQPEHPRMSQFRKTPYVFDIAKLKNVKPIGQGKCLDENSNMNNATKQLGEAIGKLPKSGVKKSGDAGKSGVGPLKRGDDHKGGTDSKEFSTDTKFGKTGTHMALNVPLSNTLQFRPAGNCSFQEDLWSTIISKTATGKGKRIHTDASKHQESDKTDCCPPQTNEKTDMFKTLFGNSQRREFDGIDSCEEKPPKCPSESDFDITKAVPHAFAGASPKLEEERQKDLYYRYHNLTFADLHTHLSQQRTFAVKAPNNKLAGECRKEEEKLTECLKKSKEDV